MRPLLSFVLLAFTLLIMGKFIFSSFFYIYFSLCGFYLYFSVCLIGTVGTHGLQVEDASVASTSHRADTLLIAGSRLPDCMHACGSCSRCRLVRVRFICAVGPAEAETCPVAYKCMCSNRTYHVP